MELSYTAWDLQTFGADCGYDGPPFQWDEERRHIIRCELDAAFFHIYLGDEKEWNEKGSKELWSYFPTPRHATEYILDTFRILRERDEAAYGTYRTKETILEIYDGMAESVRSATQYKTRLDPPPGPSAVQYGGFLPPAEYTDGQTKPSMWPWYLHPLKARK